MLRGFHLISAAAAGSGRGFCRMLRRFRETKVMSLMEGCRCCGVGGVDGSGGKGDFGLFMVRIDLGGDCM